MQPPVRSSSPHYTFYFLTTNPHHSPTSTFLESAIGLLTHPQFRLCHLHSLAGLIPFKLWTERTCAAYSYYMHFDRHLVPDPICIFLQRIRAQIHRMSSLHPHQVHASCQRLEMTGMYATTRFYHIANLISSCNRLTP